MFACRSNAARLLVVFRIQRARHEESSFVYNSLGKDSISASFVSTDSSASPTVVSSASSRSSSPTVLADSPASQRLRWYHRFLSERNFAYALMAYLALLIVANVPIVAVLSVEDDCQEAYRVVKLIATGLAFLVFFASLSELWTLRYWSNCWNVRVIKVINLFDISDKLYSSIDVLSIFRFVWRASCDLLQILCFYH